MNRHSDVPPNIGDQSFDPVVPVITPTIIM
jgi:hypothetical protein